MKNKVRKKVEMKKFTRYQINHITLHHLDKATKTNVKERMNIKTIKKICKVSAH